MGFAFQKSFVLKFFLVGVFERLITGFSQLRSLLFKWQSTNQRIKEQNTICRLCKRLRAAQNILEEGWPFAFQS